MRAIAGSVLLFIMFGSSACLQGPQVKAPVPVTPPAPAPPPLPPAVIEPQTVAKLPEPQAIPADALPPRPAIEYPPAVESPRVVTAPAAPTRRRPRAASPAVTPEPAAPVEEPVVVPAPPQALRSAEDRTTSKDSVAAILEDVRKQLIKVEARPKDATTTAAVNRIASLVRLAEQSSAKNELRQAESLAKRAFAIAKDLNRPR